MVCAWLYTRAQTNVGTFECLFVLLWAAGVDISTFTSHSVRGASSSAAAGVGMTVNDILKVADWCSESTFKRFYYHPSHDPSYVTVWAKTSLVHTIKNI